MGKLIGRPPKPFWSRVNVTDTCWLWIGPRNLEGRGQIRVNGRLTLVPRLMYELACGGGKIPDGLIVRHKCDDPRCVRPDHLEIGTQADNSRDIVSGHRWGKV